MPPIGAPGVAISLAAFVVVYLTVFGAGVVLMLRIMATPSRCPQSRDFRTGMVPIIVVYTGYAYWVFRGKVKAGAHYH